MFILSIIIAIIIGYLYKGQLRNLMQLQIQGFAFIFASFLVELMAKMLLKMNIIELGIVSYTLHLITYVLLFIMLFKNKKNLGFKFIGVGSLLNALVIFANDGIMPVGQWALSKLGISTTTQIEGMYLVMNDKMNFRILGDILPVHLKKIAFILSIGDLFIMLGIILVIAQGMKQNNKVAEPI